MTAVMAPLERLPSVTSVISASTRPASHIISSASRHTASARGCEPCSYSVRSSVYEQYLTAENSTLVEVCIV